MKRVLLSATVWLAASNSLHPQTTASSPTPSAETGQKPFLSAVAKIVEPPLPSPTPVKFVSFSSSTPKPSPSPSASATPKTTIRFRPTKEGVDDPFYDVPWAVHLPLDIGFEGGPVGVTWQGQV